ncbi:MAG: hypothetical protein EPN37_08255 [Chitinophagaceae bacterium]|nr:MAG: hypothetical protein EPN37_08255 [Chitinophagaceae bacterium]
MGKRTENINRRSFIQTTGTVAAGWVILRAPLIKGTSQKSLEHETNISTPTMKGSSNRNWWEKGPLRIVEMEEGYPVKTKVRLLEEVGANMEHLTTFSGTSPGTNFNFDHHLFSGKGVDLLSLNDYCNEMHKGGIKVVIYYNVHAINSSYANQHPDWQQIQGNGKPIEHLYEINSSFCINSPWREEVFRYLRKLANYKIDGIFFDGPIFFANTCYCDSCKKLFKNKYKKDIPLKSKLSITRTGEDWNNLIEFQSDSIASFLKESNKILKGINQELLFYMNGSTIGPTWPTGRDNRKNIKETDLLGAEGGFLYGSLTESIYKPGAVAKLLETQADGKPRVIFDAGKLGPWSSSTLPEGEISILYSQTITHQANVWMAVTDKLNLHKEEMDTIKRYNDFIGKNKEPFFKTKSLANIALMWPQRGSNFYAGSSIPLTDFTKHIGSERGGDLVGEFYGLYDGLSRNHFPFDVIDEGALEKDLDRYNLIILPNAPCFDKEEANKIREFVLNGGNIIATFETSLYDKKGIKLNNFQLQDVFGVEKLGDSFGPLNYDYIYFNDEDGFTNRGIKEMFTYAPTYGLKLTPIKGAKTLSSFCIPLSGNYSGRPEKSDVPFIIENKYGKGKAIYFAGTFGDSLNKFHFPEYYQVVSNCMSELSSSLVRMDDTPSSVEITLRRSEDSIYLYLVNFTSSLVRPIQKIIPYPNLHVTLLLDLEKKVKSVKALWLNKDIKFKQEGISTSFTLPVLKDYEIVRVLI